MILTFTYRNYREKIAERHVVPQQIAWFADPPEEYGYKPGWFLHAYDMNKMARRSFAFSNIIQPEGKQALFDFTTTVDQASIASLLKGVQKLVDSVKKDEHGTPIGRFQDGNGGLVSQETHKAVLEVEKLLQFYK